MKTVEELILEGRKVVDVSDARGAEAFVKQYCLEMSGEDQYSVILGILSPEAPKLALKPKTSSLKSKPAQVVEANGSDS